jgi:hypothetical protein
VAIDDLGTHQQSATGHLASHSSPAAVHRGSSAAQDRCAPGFFSVLTRCQQHERP